MDNKNNKVTYNKNFLTKPSLKPAFLLDDIMDSFFNTRRSSYQEGFLAPTVDLVAKENEYILKAELQGVSKDDIEVEVSDTHILLKAEKKEDEECRNCDYYYRESIHGKMMREIPLPEKINKEKTEVKFENGILTLKMPKAEEVKTRKIKL